MEHGGGLTRHWMNRFCLQFFTDHHFCHCQIENSSAIPSYVYITINASGVESGSGSGSSGPYGGVVHSFAVYGGSLSGSEARSLFLGGMPPSRPVARNFEAHIDEDAEVGGGGSHPPEWYGERIDPSRFVAEGGGGGGGGRRHGRRRERDGRDGRVRVDTAAVRSPGRGPAPPLGREDRHRALLLLNPRGGGIRPDADGGDIVPPPEG